MDVRDGPPDPTPRRRRRFGRRLALVALAALAAGALFVDRQVREGFADGRCRDRVRIYAAPFVVSIGASLEKSGVFTELEALGYRAVPDEPAVPGTYRRSARHLEIFLHRAPRGDGLGERPAARVDVEIEDGRVVGIAGPEPGERSPSLVLEPRQLPGVLERHWTSRAGLALGEVPPHVVDAVLAAEDVRFLKHPGLDLGSLARAVQVNWEAQEVRQGGSTITQQVVKNHFLTRDRTLLRKLREIPLTLALERRFSKEEILGCYLATVYLGHDRLVGVYGFAEAARVYFDKPVGKLTIGEGAVLAGMIRSPNPLSPLRHPERARRRRDQVLAHLEELGWITPAQAKAARAERIPATPKRVAANEVWFLAEARRELEALSLAPEKLPVGSAIFTTLDVRLQQIASETVASAIRQFESDRLVRRGVQMAVVALDPRDGAIRALVGGRDYLKSQLDRATRIRRPIGSLFKPFVYLAAFDDAGAGLTAASVLADEPLEIGSGPSSWSPRNHDGRFRGPVTLREALEDSLNVPVVRVVEQIGVDRVGRFGERFALGREGLPRYPSVALGAFDASLLDVVASYAVFPGGGAEPVPAAIAAVEAPTGAALYRPWRSPRRLVDPGLAYVVHSLLEGVVDRGTAHAIRSSGLDRPLAGKTGTTDDYRDAWFVGYTPTLVVGVWVGFDDERSLPGAAAKVALPVWSTIVKRALAGAPVERFPVPGGVDLVRIDRASGRRADPACGPSLTEAFLPGTAPVESCRPGATAEAPEPGDVAPASRGPRRWIGDLLSRLRASW